MEKPNILWYCTDQQRFDTIACLGNRHIRTPNLDRLASRGVSFTRAYTQSPICTPSRATFLTGRYPATHHVHRNGCDFFPPAETLVTKTLADHGYDCGLVGKLHLSRAKGRVEVRPDDGYRYFQWSHHPRPDWETGHSYAEWLQNEKGVDPAEVFKDQIHLAYGSGVPAEYHQTVWCTEKSIEFISQERNGPWMLSVNPFDPHPPFDPPDEYLERYDPADLPYPVFAEGDIEHQRTLSVVDQQSKAAVDPRNTAGLPDRVSGSGDTASVPPSRYDSRLIKACYYAMIEQIDYEFGRIVDALEERGQLENTIIIFASDHGELLGDHGLLYKGCRFYEGLVRVPLIISWPDSWEPDRVSDAMIELIDLAPTILDGAGIAVPAAMQGMSLAPMLDGDSDLHTHKSHVVSEYYDAVDLPDGTHASMYFDGRYKTVMYHNHDLGEMYDLLEDPDECNDLWEKDGNLQLREELIRKHFNAIMATSGAGVERTGSY